MKPIIRCITPAAFLSVNWAGGITRQIAISPENAVYGERDFLWRISSASVELEESDFTPLPDYERMISVLDGRMELTHGDGESRLLLPGDIYRFDGGAYTHSKGKCTDFNLMLRKGRCTGSLTYLQLDGGRDYAFPDMAEKGQILLFCVKGGGLLSDGESSASFTEGEAVLLTHGGNPVLRCQKQSAFLAADMIPT